MSESAILSAARAVAAATFPTAKDWSDDPANIKPESMPAFVVTVTRDGATQEAMGSDLEEVQLTIEVEVFDAYETNQDGREVIGAKGEAVRDALKADAALDALLDRVTGSTFEVDIASGRKRLARATVGLLAEATF
ncbi:hypothetical protein [Ruegeria atlantica]|uniref:hypothetical protein n=1 Tax=Ruegeria atlantica TaxID=81569 RepID=UPI00148060C0|nr:hypothetical protein [Ruegeria atlantica]